MKPIIWVLSHNSALLSKLPDSIVSRLEGNTKHTQAQISDSTGASITTKGPYIRFPKIQPPVGERKLYLSIVGPTQQSVESAKAELNGLLLQEPSFPSSPSPSQQLVPNPYVDAFMRITLN